jgi:uncharacterized membrane-anchored protein
MSENTGKAIVVLLALILAVLVFGKDALGQWFIWGVGLFVVVAVVGGIWRFIVFAYGDEYRKSMDESRENGGWPILTVLFWVGAAGNIVVLIWTLFLTFGAGIPFKEAFLEVPFFWVPLALIMSGYLLNEFIQWLKERAKGP